MTQDTCHDTAESAVIAARHLSTSYDCVIVTETSIDTVTNEPIGEPVVLVVHREIPTS